jgi:hypothetical protein
LLFSRCRATRTSVHEITEPVSGEGHPCPGAVLDGDGFCREDGEESREKGKNDEGKSVKIVSMAILAVKEAVETRKARSAMVQEREQAEEKAYPCLFSWESQIRRYREVQKVSRAESCALARQGGLAIVAVLVRRGELRVRRWSTTSKESCRDGDELLRPAWAGQSEPFSLR